MLTIDSKTLERILRALLACQRSGQCGAAEFERLLNFLLWMGRVC